jgi:hypothetical protein
MPPLPGWYLKVPALLESLKAPGSPPFLDRAAIEHLFHLRRRQAIRLMGMCGGYQVGKTFLVERKSVTAYLERVAKTGLPKTAIQRKQRVLEVLNQVENARTARLARIATGIGAPRTSSLPGAFRLVAPGQLQINFTGAEDLLARVAEMISLAASNFAEFQAAIEGGK